MSDQQAKTVGCTRNSWITRDTLKWYGFEIPHDNVSQRVKVFCGNQCSFPACLGIVVSADEEKAASDQIPDDHGTSQERSSARAHLDRLAGNDPVVERQMRLFRSGLSSES